jgi:hypothetical protein
MFAVLPVNLFIGAWLNGKRYGINTILCLLSYSVSPGFILIAPFFQASAASFPMFLALTGQWLWALLIPVMLFMGKGFLLRWATGKYKASKVPVFLKWDNRKIVYMLKTIFYYFHTGLLASKPTMYPMRFKLFGMVDEETEKAYKFDLAALGGLTILLLTIFGYLWQPDTFVGLLWWLVTISVYSNWITLTVPLAHRYMYLPNVGLMVFLATVLSYIHPLAWVPVAIIYATRTFSFMDMFENMEKFLEYHCYHQPEDDQCWIFKCNRHARLGDVFGVMYNSDCGLHYNPNSANLWTTRASGFNYIGKYDLSKECVAQARKVAKGLFVGIAEEKLIEIEKKYPKTEAVNERCNTKD